MIETVPVNQRVYLILERGSAGRTVMRLLLRPPVLGSDAQAALLLRGVIMDGSVMDVDLVTDPKQDPDLTGPDGPNGWTPVLMYEQDGTRTLLKVAEWVRSEGKPAIGYLTAGGPLTTDKSAAANFNAGKRVDLFSAVSGADGITTVAFVPPFANVPAKALPLANPNVAEVVAGTLTKDGCKVRVKASTLVNGVYALVAGATAFVIAIEA